MADIYLLLVLYLPYHCCGIVIGVGDGGWYTGPVEQTSERWPIGDRPRIITPVVLVVMIS